MAFSSLAFCSPLAGTWHRPYCVPEDINTHAFQVCVCLHFAGSSVPVRIRSSEVLRGCPSQWQLPLPSQRRLLLLHMCECVCVSRILRSILRQIPSHVRPECLFQRVSVLRKSKAASWPFSSQKTFPPVIPLLTRAPPMCQNTPAELLPAGREPGKHQRRPVSCRLPGSHVLPQHQSSQDKYDSGKWWRDGQEWKEAEGRDGDNAKGVRWMS